MIIVLGNMEVKDGTFGELEAGLHDLVAATQQDDGYISYDFARDVNNPNLIRFAERWRDRAALDAHNATPHMAAFKEVVGPHLAGAPEILLFEAAEAGKLA